MTSTSSAADTGLPISRTQLEQSIQQAIDLLDFLDSDADLEPSLGSYHPANGYDAEGDDSDLELSGDEHEPSLGSLDGRVDQRQWSAGGTDDGEDEHDGREPEIDEPSLGSFDRMVNQEKSYRQTAATWFPGQDHEADPAEHRGPPHFASDVDVQAARDAGWRLGKIAGRKPGLSGKHPKSRPRKSICNVGPMIRVVCL